MSRIIVAEDDEAIAALCKDILTDSGYTVDCGYGERALALIFANPPDLVLLDLAMPGMDGTEIITEMRKHPATTHIPIIVTTAFRHPDRFFSGLDVQGFIIKPWEIAVLLGVVRNTLTP